MKLSDFPVGTQVRFTDMMGITDSGVITENPSQYDSSLLSVQFSQFQLLVWFVDESLCRHRVTGQCHVTNKCGMCTYYSIDKLVVTQFANSKQSVTPSPAHTKDSDAPTRKIVINDRSSCFCNVFYIGHCVHK